MQRQLGSRRIAIGAAVVWILSGSALFADGVGGRRASAFEFDLAFPSRGHAAEGHVKGPFARGSWTVQTYASAAFGDKAGELYSGHVGVGYSLLGNVSINVEALGGYANIERLGRVSGGGSGFWGADTIVRWGFLQGRFLGRESAVYAEGGLGIMQSHRSFPAKGNHFNFRPQAGLGVLHRLHHDLHLMAGAKWLHVSNAGLDADNPGADQPVFYLGVLAPF